MITIFMLIIPMTFTFFKPITRLISNQVRVYQAYVQLNNIQEWVRMDVESADAIVVSEKSLTLLVSGQPVHYSLISSDFIRTKEQNIHLNTDVLRLLDVSFLLRGKVLDVRYVFAVSNGSMKLLEDAYYAWNLQ